MKQTLTNNTIYELATSQALKDFKSYIPAKANFAMQKNFQTLAAAAQGIEETRLKIAKRYGDLDEEGSRYTFSDENLEIVNKELVDLLTIEQELEIRMIKIDDLGSAEFTPEQMQLLMFMIED